MNLERIHALHEAAENTPIPDGLLVLTRDHCGLCKQSMVNNAYTQVTMNNTPITWLNIDSEKGSEKFYALPGIGVTDDTVTAAGKTIVGMPTVLRINGGTVTEILKFGEIAAGELNRY